MDRTEAKYIKKRWQQYTEELYKKFFMTQITTMVYHSPRATSWNAKSSEP